MIKFLTEKRIKKRHFHADRQKLTADKEKDIKEKKQKCEIRIVTFLNNTKNTTCKRKMKKWPEIKVQSYFLETRTLQSLKNGELLEGAAWYWVTARDTWARFKCRGDVNSERKSHKLLWRGCSSTATGIYLHLSPTEPLLRLLTPWDNTHTNVVRLNLLLLLDFLRE